MADPKQQLDQITIALEQVGRVAGAVGSQIQKALTTGINTGTDFANVLGGISNATKLIPGPIGAVTSALTGLASAGLGLVSKEADRLRGIFANTFASAISGAQSLQTTLNQTRIENFTRRFQELLSAGVEQGEAFRRARTEAGTIYDQVVATLSAENQRIRANETIVEFQRRQARALQQQQGIQVDIGRQAGRVALERAGAARFAEEGRARALEAGATPGQAAARAQADLAALELRSRLIATGVPAEEALAQARATLADQTAILAEEALNLERAQTEGALALRNRADRQQNLVQTANLLLLRRQASTGEILVEHTRERQEANDQYNRGLITSNQLTERLNQIQRNERVEQAFRRGEQVNQILERQRTPLQALRREQERLAGLQGEFAARPGGGQEFARAQANALRDFIDANRFQEQFVGALEQGSVAAAVASAKAEAQERAQDPAIALREAVERNNQLQEARNRADQELLAEFQRLRAEGAI